MRVGDLVEAGDQGALHLRELVCVGVAVRLAEGDDPLVVSRPRGLVQPSLGHDLHTKALHLAQPWLRGESSLGDEQLEDRAPAGTDDLSDRAAPVDELSCHPFGIRR